MTQQAAIPLSFRDFQPSDYERITEIYNANFPEYPNSVSEFRYWDEMIDKSKYHFKRYACLGKDRGDVLGFGTVQHSLWMFDPRKFRVDVMVDPQYQNKGIGSQIFEKVAQDLKTLSATTAWAQVKEDLPRAVRFAQKSGFFEKNRVWESRLSTREFDASRFQNYADKTSRDGVKISILPEERARDPTSLSRLYELVQHVNADVPLPVPYTRTSYEQWEASELKNPSLVPEAYFIASDGTQYVGLSNGFRSDKEPETLIQGMTGVRREYRGRGIAVALKLRVIDYAKQNRYDKIKTWNDSLNTPMLAINTKLGFKREVGWITMQKNLA